jgi:hypothetical protein
MSAHRARPELIGRQRKRRSFGSRSAAAQRSVVDRPHQGRRLVRADFVGRLSEGSANGREAKITLSEWYGMIFSGAAISPKSRLFETLQHMVVRCLSAELGSESLSI